MPFLRVLKRQRWVLSIATVLFFIGQLGVITHSLHLDTGGGKVEVACGFCATSHASMDGPQTGAMAKVDYPPDEPSGSETSILASFFVGGSARARAPPLG
jgi:hypothetical protein